MPGAGGPSPAARAAGTGPAAALPLAARLVAGQRRAGQCGDDRGCGQAAGEQGPLAVGSGPPVIEPAQQPGYRLGVAVVPQRGGDVLEQAVGLDYSISLRRPARLEILAG